MHMRFSSLTDQKCADWSAKYGAKKSIFVNIDSYVDNTLSIIDMDFLYR